jgi:hypothetical protein
MMPYSPRGVHVFDACRLLSAFKCDCASFNFYLDKCSITWKVSSSPFMISFSEDLVIPGTITPSLEHYLALLICLISAGLSSPPSKWDSWELDPKFIKAMSCWTIDHPETTLDRVLDNICAGIDNGKDLLDLIPDSPFPARSLLTALGYLIKLGAVYRFGLSLCGFSDNGYSVCIQGEVRSPKICEGCYSMGRGRTGGISEW